MDMENDFTTGLQETRNGRIYYLHHAGKGRSLVFLHGVGASHIVWKRLVELMPDSYDVYLLDLLGHGMSDAPTIDYTIEAQVYSLRDFLSAQNRLDCVVIGHSYGAWTAVYYASLFHELSGIVLEDSAGIKEEFDDIIESGMVAEYKDSMLKQLVNMNNNKEYVMKSILNEDFAIRNQLTKDVLARISTKTVVVWGSDDKIVESKYASYLSSGIKGSVLKVVQGAGHSPHYAHAQEFYNVLSGFLSTLG
jgi:pimeloyl-ACP methyl ester carboxylesterase